MLQFNIRENFPDQRKRKMGFIYFLLPLELDRKRFLIQSLKGILYNILFCLAALVTLMEWT